MGKCDDLRSYRAQHYREISRPGRRPTPMAYLEGEDGHQDVSSEQVPTMTIHITAIGELLFFL